MTLKKWIILAMLNFAIVLIACLTVFKDCHAESIYLGSWTRHINPKPYYNDTHGLIGWESDRGLFVATMENSFEKRSYLLAKSWTRPSGLTFKVGGVTGYDDWYRNTGLRVMPFATVGYTYKILDFNIVPGAYSLGFKVSY